MLNLLFISDSPKAVHIKNELQPLLKVIIDVVTDFDHGLKDVFEKRPATICIQDQINGVSGESVARHIQMLLGNSAPKFILLHSGNEKAKPINGLFENLVDFSQSNDAITKDLLDALKSLFGDQWLKAYIPPKRLPASVRSSLSVPEESRKDADKLVDEFLSDLEMPVLPRESDHIQPVPNQGNVHGEPSRVAQPETPHVSAYSAGLNEPPKIQSASDEIVDLLLAEVKKAGRDESSASAASTVGSEIIPGDLPKVVTVAERHDIPVTDETAPIKATSSRRTSSKKAADSPVGGKDTIVEPEIVKPQIIPPAEKFRISQEPLPAAEHIPEDLLLAFEENYRSESLFRRRSFVIALFCIICAAGGWFLLTQKPLLVSSLKQRLMPVSEKKQTSSPPAVAVQIQKPVTLPVTVPAVSPVLPSFIPKEGHDSTFAQNKPGWERYVGTQYDFRVFTTQGKIQAIQVLAISESISETLIKTVLQEFAGSTHFKIHSRSTKAGVRVENGRIQGAGDVIFYRKSGAVRAFVVSVN